MQSLTSYSNSVQALRHQQNNVRPELSICWRGGVGSGDGRGLEGERAPFSYQMHTQ